MSHNLHIKLLCFVVAALLWIQVASNVDVEEIVQLPLEVVGLPDSLVVREASLPERARVRIKGSKLQLLMRDLIRRDVGRAQLYLADAVPGLMRYELTPDDVRVSAVPLEILTPQDLRFRVHRRVLRRLPVRVVLEGQLDSEHTLSGRPEITPTEVEVSGPESLIATLDHINTIPIQLSRNRQTFTVRAALQPPDTDIRLLPIEVQVIVAIDRLVERSFTDVPLAVLSDLDPSWVHVDPTSAQVRITGPSSIVDSLQPEDVSVLVHVSELEPGIYELPAEVVVPEGTGSSSVDPLVFRVVVEKPSGDR